jgi:hypothetical protein
MTINQYLHVLRDRFGLDKTSIQDSQIHLDAAIAWLCHAQDMTPDAGVSQTYLVRSKRWANSYPETTGYIIPTFYSYAALTGREDIRKRAKEMADWECEIQTDSGGVLAGALGDSDQPTIFNTGQVLFGWSRAFEEVGDEDYRTAAVKAANWLCKVQDDDGCWRKFGSPMTSKSINTYNTRSAWGLVRVYQITEDKRYLQAAIKNIEWAMGQRHNNGWLPQNCLQDDTQPFVHTIAYAMRGIMEVGFFANREDFIKQAMVMGDALLAALPNNGFLPGRFDQNWQPTAKWSCLTGDAQIAINWSRLYQITGEEKYRQAVKRIITFVKSTQKLTGDASDVGAVKGSHPINGGYHPWQHPNWAAKFFADALMQELTICNAQAGWEFRNDG